MAAADVRKGDPGYCKKADRVERETMMTMYKQMNLDEQAEVRRIVARALKEDVGGGDITTRALIPGYRQVRARILTRENCVVCGGRVAEMVFRSLDEEVSVEILRPDGVRAGPGDALLLIEGLAEPVLAAERTALNFMQRMTGIATLTSEFVARVEKHGVMIMDTRKTTPGLRIIEKYAVQCGGGVNHRMGLYDAILIKDNHKKLIAEDGMSLTDAVRAARRAAPDKIVEVEVESMEELRAALDGRPDWILLDNMDPETMRECVRLCAGKVKTEASGGITLDIVEEVAATGVDAISLGCLSHSAPAADLSLEVEG